MKTPKKNLITEINRIHQLMGVKKLITESRRLLIPLLKIAEEIVEYAASKKLDNATQSSINQLSTGSKGFLDSKGNPVPLEVEDYIKIFDDLKKSTNPAIIAKMAELDGRIAASIKNNLSEITDTTEVRELIKQIIDDGGTLDDVNNLLKQLFEKRFKNYVNIATVVDDTGNVIKKLMDDYLEGIRKVYVDLGGKLDNLADDAGGSVAKDILELSPVFVRYTNEVGKKMKPLLDKVLGLIEKRTSPNLTDAEKRTIPQIDEQIKKLMDEINNINSEYVKSLEAQIKYGVESGPVENRARWAEIDSYITDLKSRLGDWGATKGVAPGTEYWGWIFEAWQASKTFEKNILKFFNLFKYPEYFAEAWTRGKEALTRAKGIKEEVLAYERNVNSDLAAKVPWKYKHLFPGSSRGLPRPMKQKDGTELYYPGAYNQILKYETKNKMVRAYLSLFAEKLFIVLRTQLYYSVAFAAYRTFKFWRADWGDYGVEKKYGSCITETSQAIKDGKLDWEDSGFQNMTDEEKTKFFSEFPPCLQELLQSKEFFDNEFLNFMTRAEFWSRGRREQAALGYFIEAFMDVNVYDPLRLITGSLLNVFIKVFPGLREEFWKAEETGNMTELEQFLQDTANQLERDTAAVDNQADTLLQNMTDREIEEAFRVLDSLSQNTDIEIVLPSPDN